MRLDLPRCPTTDLERISCACPGCESFTMTDQEKALRSGVIPISQLAPPVQPRYRMQVRQPTTPTPWANPTPDVIDCQHPHDTELCNPCWEQLQICLGDIPALVQDLNLAVAKMVRFAPHGHRKGDLETPDEDPVMINLGASATLARLAEALRTPTPTNGWTVGQAAVAQSRRLLNTQDLRIMVGVGDWAATISRAVVTAHHMIDRPADRWFYGSCPTCHVDLYDDRGIDEVHCRDCGYRAKMIVHHALMLDQREDEWLTVDELVGVFTKAGQPITRQRIKDLVRRQGLARERQKKWRWVGDRHGNQRIVSSEVWVHRIGDVRDLLDELAATG